jgi:LytS/YehU family sensor histidine kinase
MKKSIEISVHIFFWIVFTAFAFMLSKIYLQAKPDAQFGNHLVYVISLEVVMGLLFFYTTFFGIPWARKKISRYMILSSVLVFLLLFFAFPAMSIGIWEVMSSIIPHVIVIFLALIFRKFSDSIRLEQEKQALLLQNTQSELALLKMQVSPHFLFNTLNNIDYLVTFDTEKASGSIAKLGAILRYMIYDAEVEKIALEKELRHIEDYIDLLRLRTAGENYLQYRLNGRPEQLRIAPMLFLPLIENAYKHSAVKEGENIINIEISIEKSNLQFVISNEYDTYRKSTTKVGGLGLNIVKRRLELIYPERHSLTITKDNKRFKVELTLELDEN